MRERELKVCQPGPISTGRISELAVSASSSHRQVRTQNGGYGGAGVWASEGNCLRGPLKSFRIMTVSQQQAWGNDNPFIVSPVELVLSLPGDQ